MKTVIDWMFANGVVEDTRELNLLHVGFDHMPYDKFVALTQADIELWLSSIAPNRPLPYAELGQLLRRSVVGRTITALTIKGEILSGLSELIQRVTGLDANGVLSLKAQSSSPLARLQAALREGVLVTQPFDEPPRHSTDISKVAFGEVSATQSPPRVEEVGFWQHPLNTGSVRTFRLGGPGRSGC